METSRKKTIGLVVSGILFFTLAFASEYYFLHYGTSITRTAVEGGARLEWRSQYGVAIASMLWFILGMVSFLQAGMRASQDN